MSTTRPLSDTTKAKTTEPDIDNKEENIERRIKVIGGRPITYFYYKPKLPSHIVDTEVTRSNYSQWSTYKKSLSTEFLEMPFVNNLLKGDAPTYLKLGLCFDLPIPIPNKFVIQFGMNEGYYFCKNLLDYQVTGYDFIAPKQPQPKNVVRRLVDLNKTMTETILVDGNKTQKNIIKLAYEAQLKTDLANPSHILVIHLLEYLEVPMQCLLLFKLIDIAKPGSIFYIQTHSYYDPEDLPTKRIYEETSKLIGTSPANFYASFFAPRTDIFFISHKHDANEAVYTRIPAHAEVLIVQKR